MADSRSRRRTPSFAARLIAWQKRHGRHDLPWQRTADAYAVWVSEIMLQQTQVATVIPYYQRFLRRFPTVGSLARAPLDDVLALWSGLGYYSRARNLHQAAQSIVERHHGRLPEDIDVVQSLPGIGRSTAAAICVFAHGGRHAILDGNVKRVLARHAGVHGYPGDARVQDQLWRLAQERLPARSCVPYTQGLMDLGAGVCTRSRPRCEACPVQKDCVALAQGLTGVLPSSKPPRVQPRRATVMLLIQCGRKILLEKRAPRGIWGGLWSLPEIDDARAARQVCGERYGVRANSIRALPVVEHGFTHFRLSITPVLVTARISAPDSSRKAANAGAAIQWLPLQEAVAAALPAPVRNIIISNCF